MRELRLYSVSDVYIGFLRGFIPNVYSNKDDDRIHERKYLGVVLELNGYNYYIPLSSPKKTDYQYADGCMVIKKSLIPIIRMVRKNKEGKKELLGTLRISHMIPVPNSELIQYNIDNEEDEKYKTLVEEEISFIHNNAVKIYKSAEVMYKQKRDNFNAGYVKRALDFTYLEKLCNEYNKDK